MNTPEDAKDIFAEAQAAFAPVVGAPNDDDVKRLYEAFVNALQSIDVPGGKVNLSNILLSDDNHKPKHSGKMFDHMETPLKTCSSPRRPLFLHELSFECTSKLCITFLNQFSVYFRI